MCCPWHGPWVPSAGAQPQTVRDQESGQRHWVSVGSLKLTHPPLLLPSRKSIPKASRPTLEMKGDISIKPKFPQVYKSFLLPSHGASICAGLSSMS